MRIRRQGFILSMVWWVPYGLGACGPEPTKHAAAPAENVTDNSVPPLKRTPPSVDPTPTPAKAVEAELERIIGPKGRYMVSFDPNMFTQVTDPKERQRFHPQAEVAWRGPDGCQGVLIISPSGPNPRARLKPTAERRLTELPVIDVKTSWFEPKLYNGRSGYRWSASGGLRTEPKVLMRYRYSIAERDAWTFEVLASSPKYYALARWCHDAVTASVSF